MTAEAKPGCRVVVMRVATGGSMAVTVDGAVLASGDGAWVRESYAAVIDLATDHHRESATVEVHESDGSSFVTRVCAISRRVPAGVDREGALEGSGFLPGERVAVAVVTHHRIADPDGTVRVSSPTVPSGRLSELLMIGRASGTLHLATDG